MTKKTYKILVTAGVILSGTAMLVCAYAAFLGLTGNSIILGSMNALLAGYDFYLFMNFIDRFLNRNSFTP